MRLRSSEGDLAKTTYSLSLHFTRQCLGPANNEIDILLNVSTEYDIGVRRLPVRRVPIEDFIPQEQT